MDNKKIFIGNNEIVDDNNRVEGGFVDLDNDKYYQIKNYQLMPDFFMSIVSDADHWMYISSTGSLSAGRKNRDNALFPYFTVDKIHDYKEKTGSKTCLLIEKDGNYLLWQPFTDESLKFYSINRNLYKNTVGNKIIFEEINNDLKLVFRYSWNNSDKYGFIRKAEVEVLGNEDITFRVLDGIQNIMPYGVGYGFQNEYSNLLDAYKKNELLNKSNIGLFRLSSIPIDRAEPSEALKTTSVWNTGLDIPYDTLLSDNQLSDFCKGKNIIPEKEIKATRGAYYIVADLKLSAGERKHWLQIAEINQDNTAIVNLKLLIDNTDNIEELISADINKGTNNLQKMVSSADGFQMTNTELCYARHYSNTLYNIMRGGVYKNGYSIETEDYKKYLWEINKLVSKTHQGWLNELPGTILYQEIVNQARSKNDADLLRITYEYLPLTFSRRHGDPSRPWNVFSIETKDEDGNAVFEYQGNWRDIFQNWEALSFSFPGYIDGIISKFVNASTIDGYNPYRIMRNGIDWEEPEPDDPWSYIGYWGDHQIIYLQKLLEISENFNPGSINMMLEAEIFTYANVPYRIKSYQDIIKNSKDTVDFDGKLNKEIASEVEHLGADARLVKSRIDNQVYKVNLTEKILSTLLSKLSNLIPEAGIWLNTQRPEWNDANNALVGNGTSMVTLYYLRRFLKFWENKLDKIEVAEIPVSEEVYVLFTSIYGVFKENIELLKARFSDIDRKRFTDELGEVHSKYRTEVYNYGFSGEKSSLNVSNLYNFIEISLNYIDHSIDANRRNDGLYHAYNLISIDNNCLSIRNLYEMLEGQVAVLSSGYLSTEESLGVLNSLKASDMFREDQYSYMLYPDRDLPLFAEKNIIPQEFVGKSKLLSKLVEDNEQSVIKIDNQGNYHFNGTFRNVGSLKESLNKLRVGSYSHLVEAEIDQILAIFEDIFDHQSFTGRSGTFYGYEGLGSIYWHMVSKLLLATQECFFKAVDEGASDELVGQLKNHYYEIKAGIGLYKSPELYGAFPTDAYSHTPANSGVKQPGLTGQVKEDVISRFGEMGVRVLNGRIKFQTELLNSEEVLTECSDFEYYNVFGDIKTISLKPAQLALTYCQVPIVFRDAETDIIEIIYANGDTDMVQGLSLDSHISKEIFNRSGKIERINVMKKNLIN